MMAKMIPTAQQITKITVTTTTAAIQPIFMYHNHQNKKLIHQINSDLIIKSDKPFPSGIKGLEAESVELPGHGVGIGLKSSPSSQVSKAIKR